MSLCNSKPSGHLWLSLLSTGIVFSFVVLLVSGIDLGCF